MDKASVMKFIKSTKSMLNRHAPEILTGIGIAGMLTGTVLAVKATPKAMELIKEAEREKEDKLEPIEAVKAAWKCYIPTAITVAASTACLIGASTVNFKRNAALATAYTLSEKAIAEYKEKVIETVGETTEKEIRNKVREEKLKETPVTRSEIVVMDNGDDLCFDTLSSRYFKIDSTVIKRAENKINRIALSENYVSLNQFYDEIGLEHTEFGRTAGWKVDDGLIEIELSTLLTDNDKPCLVLDFNIPPRYGFDKFA